MRISQSRSGLPQERAAASSTTANCAKPAYCRTGSRSRPLVNQRLEANQRVRIAAQKANQANSELQNVQNELAQIESEINYRMNLIGQLKNGGCLFPLLLTSRRTCNSRGLFRTVIPRPKVCSGPPSSPYNPVVPFPTMPPANGIGSFPARNDGLYPDAAPRGMLSATRKSSSTLSGNTSSRRRSYQDQ